VSVIELEQHRSADGSDGLPAHVDVVVVGAGFSGLAMARELRRRGHRDFVVLERADDVGGVWRDNTYPGCACDVPSHLYSFSFALNPEWSSTYSPQPEIHAYLKRTAEQEGLLDRVRLGCELVDDHSGFSAKENE
jgi:cation diffusion facilitator CzcD-associated flavoprotein CzcO